MRATREYHSIDQARQAIAGRLDRARVPGLFDRFDWFASLHHHCFADRPVRILHAEEDGQEGWLFLLSPAPRRVSAIANWYSFNWSPVFDGAPDAAVQQRLIEAMARQLLKNHAQVDLYPLEEAGPLEETGPLISALRQAGWFTVQRPMGGRYLLDVDSRSFADYWSARPGKLRNLVRRKGRNSPYALSIENRLTDALWQDYINVHARSWKQPEPDAGLDFLRDLAEQESAAGTLRLGFARIDGRAVATQFWTIEHGVALIHKLSHDSAHDGGSPGTLLSHRMFAQAIDQDRVSRIDYGTGDNGYKRDWMERRIALHRIDAFNPRYLSSWLPAARTAISALVG